MENTQLQNNGSTSDTKKRGFLKSFFTNGTFILSLLFALFFITAGIIYYHFQMDSLLQQNETLLRFSYATFGWFVLLCVLDMAFNVTKKPSKIAIALSVSAMIFGIFEFIYILYKYNYGFLKTFTTNSIYVALIIIVIGIVFFILYATKYDPANYVEKPIAKKSLWSYLKLIVKKYTFAVIFITAIVFALISCIGFDPNLKDAIKVFVKANTSIIIVVASIIGITSILFCAESASRKTVNFLDVLLVAFLFALPIAIARLVIFAISLSNIVILAGATFVVIVTLIFRLASFDINAKDKTSNNSSLVKTFGLHNTLATIAISGIIVSFYVLVIYSGLFKSFFYSNSSNPDEIYPEIRAFLVGVPFVAGFIIVGASFLLSLLNLKNKFVSLSDASYYILVALCLFSYEMIPFVANKALCAIIISVCLMFALMLFVTKYRKVKKI